MPKGGARGQNLGHHIYYFTLIFLYGIIQFDLQVLFRVFLSVTSDRRVQCP